MKKWARVLVWIGIIWIVLVIVGLAVLYFNLDSIAKNVQNAASSGTEINANTAGFLSTINLNSPINSLFRGFIVLIIPSLLLFIIAWLWGRDDQQIR